MSQYLLPPSGGQVPTTQNPDVALYHAPDGMTYLTQKSPNGQITFTPVTAIVPQPIPATPITQVQPQPDPPRGRDPLVTMLIILGSVVGVIVVAWFIGFLAGRSGQQTVYYPREPICDTRRSSFLFWSHTEKDCH